MSEKNKRTFGAAGEKIALDYLTSNGYDLIEQNYRVGRLGEIDIIAREGEYICFIEVKTRSSYVYGTPSESVSKKKQSNIILIANIYIKQHFLFNENIRFDIVEVLVNRKEKEIEVKQINVIKNAFY